MKNRKRIIGLFLLVAIMLIGVGYAALTDTLTIIGNAHIDLNAASNTFDERVYFVSGEVKQVACESGDSGKDEINATNTDDATFTANSLAVKNDYIVFEFVIKNESNAAAEITINAKKLSGADNPSNSNDEKFDIEVEFLDNDNVADAAGGTVTVLVKISVIDVVTVETSATFGVELIASTVELQ